MASGSICTDDGKLKLGKDAALTIVSVLLPRCATREKKSDYKSMKKCNEWLGDLAGRGTTWEDELTAIFQTRGAEDHSPGSNP